MEKYADATRGAENSYEALHAVGAAPARRRRGRRDEVQAAPDSRRAQVNRGFRLLKPTTWNQFDGEPGAYDVRWVDVVAPAESVGVSARASEAATARRHASRAASPARIAALKTSSRCQRGDERSDRRRAMRDRFVFACETFREMRDEKERLLSRVKNK